MRKEVQKHLDEMEVTCAAIPPNIVIGPFLMVTESTRQQLMKKRKAITQALLEMFSRELYIRAENVSRLNILNLSAYLGGGKWLSGYSVRLKSQAQY